MVHIDAHTDTWGEPVRLEVHARRAVPARRGARAARSEAHDPDRHPRRPEPAWTASTSRSRTACGSCSWRSSPTLGVERVIDEARRVVGDGPTYISFDVDGLDPVYAPGTGTPEIGGISTLEAQRLLHGLRGLNLIGGDVVEVAPPYDQTGNTALVGATMMFEILCLVADSHFGQRAVAAG